MITKFSVFFRKLRRFFSRSYWELRLLPLSKSEGTASAPGLIFVQIDGLSQTQFRRALAKGRMPFLSRLLKREQYKEYTHYSGLPSSTPAVQGELFYGVKTCVPSFNFLDRDTGKVLVMFNPADAAEIEKRLSNGNPGLLEGGSSYSNIFVGGAAESHFCAASTGWKAFLKLFYPLRWVFLIFHLDILIRISVLLSIEIVLALWDCIKGMLKGERFFFELQFILTRVFLCVLMRELILLGGKIDIARGLPVIHMNFFGYDEQSHRRGPSSAFAHWTLRGIDRAISQIWNEAGLSERRDYDVWIYSDHGQEDTLPYPVATQEHLDKVMTKIFEDAAPCKLEGEKRVRPPGHFSQKHSGPSVFFSYAESQNEAGNCRVTLAGMGPLCHVYPDREFPFQEKIKIAGEMIRTAKVPVVLIPEEGRRAVRAVTEAGDYELPRDAAKIFGEDHPFLAEVGEDLVNLCFHPNAGEFVLSGWLAKKRPMTFPTENGSHAGYGSEETHAFALLPQDAPVPDREHAYLRPLHLRRAALRLLGRGEEERVEAGPVQPPKFLRVASYNVHGCLGMDGKISPERIARVLARFNPDAIVLQELDVDRKRSGNIHQAEAIAKKLQMTFHFHPSVQKGGHYGNAILSKHPMRLVKVGPLPRFRESREYEPRGVLWVELDLQGLKVQLMNTHLSIWPQERLIQTEALLGKDWLANEACTGPVMLAGDFNSLPGSAVHKRFCAKLADAQLIMEEHKPHKTWLRLSRIDHMFVSEDVKVCGIAVPNTALDKLASDHYPLFVDLVISRPSVLEPQEKLYVPPASKTQAP